VTSTTPDPYGAPAAVSPAPSATAATDCPASGRRLDALTGARFLAALSVFVFHVATIGVFPAASGVARVLNATTKSAGSIGVSFFFVLSGFVLTWAARPGESYGSFLRRRLVKIFPNHLVTFAAAMLAFAAAATPPGTALLNAVLLQSWVPRPEVFLSVNGSSWSLSCELFFYALFPLVLAAIRKIPARQLWRVTLTIIGIVLVLPAAVHLIPEGVVFDPAKFGTVLAGESITRMWFLYIFPPVRLLDFVIGILMARLVIEGRWIRLPVLVTVGLTAVGYVVALFTPWLITVDAATVIPLALLVPAMASSETAGRAPGWLTSRIARLLGEASFAFYLVHGIVLTYLRMRVGFARQLTVAEGGLFVAGSLVASLVLSIALHKAVEMPLVRRWGSRRRRPATHPTPPAPVLDPVAEPAAR
jgi:peptidoglycan/LPS O-acetylase OafA/YrhL